MAAVDVISPVGLDPQALFYLLGIEDCRRRILRSDRYSALRLPRTWEKQAAEFLERTRPKRFIPRRPSLKSMRRFLADDLADVSPELFDSVRQARDYLATLAPPELTNDALPLEFVPHSLQLTTLRRAYSILERPWTMWSLLGIGGFLPDEAQALMQVIPDIYREILVAVVTKAMDARGASRTWQPSRMARYQMPVLIGGVNVSIPEVADVFAAKKAQQQAPQPGSPDLDSTPTQRRANNLPTPREAAIR